MATQEEVIKAIEKFGGFATIQMLKEYFNITYSGSSTITDRVQSLRKHKIIFTMYDGYKNIYLLSKVRDYCHTV